MLDRWVAGLAGACLLICAPAAQARTWSVRSPGKTVTASVRYIFALSVCLLVGYV